MADKAIAAGTFANATGDGTFTGFEEYGDFVIILAG